MHKAFRRINRAIGNTETLVNKRFTSSWQSSSAQLRSQTIFQPHFIFPAFAVAHKFPTRSLPLFRMERCFRCTGRPDMVSRREALVTSAAVGATAVIGPWNDVIDAMSYSRRTAPQPATPVNFDVPT